MQLRILRTSSLLLWFLIAAGRTLAQEGAAAAAPDEMVAAMEERRVDAERALAKCRTLSGFDKLSERFTIERASQGYINGADESLFAILRTADTSTLNAAWWMNPVKSGVPQFDWHVFLTLFDHVDALLSRHAWLKEWRTTSPGRLLELHAFGRSPAETPTWRETFVLPVWREARFVGEPEYEVLARLDSHSWLGFYLNDSDPRILVSYSAGLPSDSSHWLDGMDVAFHPKCTEGTSSSRYLTVDPSGEHQIREYRGCAP